MGCKATPITYKSLAKVFMPLEHFTCCHIETYTNNIQSILLRLNRSTQNCKVWYLYFTQVFCTTVLVMAKPFGYVSTRLKCLVILLCRISYVKTGHIYILSLSNSCNYSQKLTIGIKSGLLLCHCDTWIFFYANYLFVDVVSCLERLSLWKMFSGPLKDLFPGLHCIYLHVFTYQHRPASLHSYKKANNPNSMYSSMSHVF